MQAQRHDGRLSSHAVIAALLVGLAGGAALTWALMPVPACDETGCPPPSESPIPVVTLTDTDFTSIPGWSDDDLAPALTAFRASCTGIAADPTRFARISSFGSPEAWVRVCALALATEAADARAFFERNFVPAIAAGDAGAIGKVTGYYEPELTGSRAPSAAYPAPVYPRPSDLITADPEGFRELLRGERLAGKVMEGVLKPYDTRAEIELSGLEGRSAPLLYLPSAADAFFLQVQGSGRITLSDGGAVRLNYAAQNGRPYTAIGAALIAEGAIPREEMSMQAIRTWLAANPERAAEIMNLNESYVFFREIPLDDPSLGPPGAEGVALTPSRSLAVDSRLYPYGLPVFVTAEGAGVDDLTRLMIAQDTGGAIRGAVRGDIFFGWGAEAEAAAGVTNAPASFVVLRPK